MAGGVRGSSTVTGSQAGGQVGRCAASPTFSCSIKVVVETRKGPDLSALEPVVFGSVKHGTVPIQASKVAW